MANARTCRWLGALAPLLMLCLLGSAAAGHAALGDPSDKLEGTPVGAHPDAAADAPEGVPVEAVEEAEGETPDASPYSDWPNWCAPVERPTCQTASDCPADPFRGGAPQRCVQPYWAKRDHLDYKICVSAWPTKSERQWRADRLAVFVDDRCGRGCSRSKLLALLKLEAVKESTFRPWKRHRLNPDKEANRRGWHRHAKRYGHEVSGGHVSFRDDGNVHYRDVERWQTGLGYYGANAALHTATWDPDAPPEVLCLEAVSTETWLRRARRSWSKISSGIDCDGDGKREFRGTSCDLSTGKCQPSWYDVHNAVAAGKLCPASLKRQAKFARRANKLGLNPYGAVRLGDLGEPIPQATQWAEVQRITARMDAETTAPW